MAACDENDPVPCKTPAELQAEETARKRLDEESDRYPWGKIVLVGLGIAACVGGAIGWCNQ